MAVLESLAGLFDPTNPFVYNVGGGQQQAQTNLSAMQLAQAGELARRQFGMDFLSRLLDIQRDPFSIVPALQAYGAAGGGTLAPVAAFAQTGGAGTPSPYGGLVDKLLSDLSTFAVTQGTKPPKPATSYEKGTPKVPKTGKYKLHKGEAVMPKETAERMRSLGMFDIGRRMRQMWNTNVAQMMMPMMSQRMR